MTERARTLHAHLQLLDRQVERTNCLLLCKVDDLELSEGEEGSLYVTAILAGPLALGPRLGGLPGWLMVKAVRMFRAEPDPQPYRIDMSLVTDVGSDIKVGGRLEELALERRLRANVIDKLPGAGRRAEGEPEERPHEEERAVEDRHVARPGATRISRFLGCTVRDIAGRVVGETIDVRLVQDGPLLAEIQQAFRIAGLVVAPRRTGQLFGYERGPGGSAPALIRSLITRLHRGSRYVTWEQVESVAGGEIRLRVPADDLAPLTLLYERDGG
jgi:hypothetical protein